MRRTFVVRLAQRLVRLYPAVWRARYAAEVLDVLQARPATWGDVVNLALHMGYTHLHPDLMAHSDQSRGERLVMLMRTLRSSEIAIFWAFVAAMIAWLQFGGLVDGGPYMPLTDSAGSWPFVGISPANGISAALAVQSAAVDLALLAMLAGGVPLVLAAWRRAPSLRWLFLVPVAAFLGALAPGILTLLFWPGQLRINLTFESPFTIAYCVWFVGLATVSALALSRAIAGGEPGGRLLRYAYLSGVVTTLALLLLLGATIVWGIAAHQEYPALFDHTALALGHVTFASWLCDVLVMAGAAAVAVLATIRGGGTRDPVAIAGSPAPARDAGA